MRGARAVAALGLVLVLAAGCRPSSPTTSLGKIPVAGSPGAYAWGPDTALSPWAGEPRRTFGLDPPELLSPGSGALPLPSRSVVPTGARQTTIDRVMGRVNTDIITLSEVQELAQSIILRIRNELPPERHEKEIRKAQSIVLDRIIEQRLQVQQAERLGVAVSERELDEAVADVIAKNNISPEQLDALLGREGLTMDQYRQKLKDQIVRRRIFNFEVTSRVQLSDADVRDYYREHAQEFIPPPAVAVSQVFLALPSNGDEAARRAVHEKAARVLKALEEGEPLPELARAYSEDPTGALGGKIGRFAKGDMVPGLDKVAFEMREGEIRGPIVTDRGLHVLKVDRRWGDKPIPLEEIASRIRSVLLSQRRQERYEEWMETLRKDAFIERADLGQVPVDGG
ncbi:MAG: peptidylprolyl isomerase [bacterium]|nr:peptidylprolyl isomerase [bacterium]